MAATGTPPPRPGTTGVGRGAGAHRPSTGLPDRPLQTSPETTSSAPPAPSPDWAAQTADSIERAVAAVRAKTAEPLEKVALTLVYGLVAGIVGVAAMVLGAVALVRVLDLLIPGDVWAAHALVGGIFVLGGLFLWRKRTVKTVKV